MADEIITAPGEKLRTIRLYGHLGAKFGREHKIWIKTPAEALCAFCATFGAFEQFMRDESHAYAVLVGKEHLHLQTDLNQLHEPPGDGVIRVVPVPAGAKRGGLFQTVLGVALLTTAWTNPWGLAASSALLTGTASVGVGLTLGGVAQMLSPQPKLDLSAGTDNRTSDYFSGPAQTVGVGNPVPLFYGEGIIGSVPVSAGIYAQDSH